MKVKGWLTIITVVLAIGAYLVYHYGYLVYQEYDYVTTFDDVHGLQISSPIYINGARVGSVEDIELHGSDDVTVILSIKKEIELPVGTKAVVQSTGLVSNKRINLEISDNTEILKHNDTIIGLYDTSVYEMNDQIDPLIISTKTAIKNTQQNLDEVQNNFEKGAGRKMQRDIISLESKSRDYRAKSQAIRNSGNKIATSLAALKQKSDSLAAGNKERTKQLESTVASTEKLSNTKLPETTDKLRKDTKKINEKISSTTALGTTIGKMLDSSDMYHKPNNTLKSANKQLKEYKDNPPPISLIGG